MIAVAQYVFLTCFRARLLAGVVMLLAATLGLALFMGGTALIEERETARTLAAGGLRLAITMGISVLICFHIQQLAHSKELTVMAARPLPRWKLVLGCFVSYGAIGTGLALLAGFAVAWTGFRTIDGYLLWLTGFVFEAAIMTAVALMFGLIISNAVSACLCTLGFYMLARLAILFVATAESPMGKTDISFADIFIFNIIKFISLLLPRLDLFADSSLLVYGISTASTALPTAQAAIYIPLLLGVAILDFSRKEL